MGNMHYLHNSGGLQFTNHDLLDRDVRLLEINSTEYIHVALWSVWQVLYRTVVSA